MKRILVIDDDEICRRTVSRVLEQSGYDVTEADNGQDGLEIALKSKPDLVVCDVVMSKLDGLGVFDKLRANPATKAVPFIFMTGMVTKEAAKRGPALGADGVLMKPFSLTELLARVKECAALPRKARRAGH